MRRPTTKTDLKLDDGPAFSKRRPQRLPATPMIDALKKIKQRETARLEALSDSKCNSIAITAEGEG